MLYGKEACNFLSKTRIVPKLAVMAQCLREGYNSELHKISITIDILK
jgi:hypothetical protein